MTLRLILRTASVALVGAALGGGIVYSVLIANTVKCRVETLPPSRSTFFDGPALDTTHGKRY